MQLELLLGLNSKECLVNENVCAHIRKTWECCVYSMLFVQYSCLQLIIKISAFWLEIVNHLNENTQILHVTFQLIYANTNNEHLFIFLYLLCTLLGTPVQVMFMLLSNQPIVWHAALSIKFCRSRSKASANVQILKQGLGDT